MGITYSTRSSNFRKVKEIDIIKRCNSSLLKEYEDKVQQYTIMGRKTV